VIPHLRERFNTRFSETVYQQFLRAVEAAVGAPIEFRICETPVFLPPELVAEMQRAAGEIIAQLRAPDYHAASRRAIPAAFDAPGEGGHPTFIQVDFAVTRDDEGRLAPKLIELQGCASLYAFQFVLAQMYQRHYGLDELAYLFNGLSDESYLALLRRAVLAGHEPEQVILMEIEPERQKTRPDFLLSEKLLGVPTVAVSDVSKEGRRLFYHRAGRAIQIQRIYNRVIIDEFVRKGARCAFDFRDELEVEWAGHPNWFFRLSKFSLPFLDHWSVPRAVFLDQLTECPERLDEFVLKPLFSFAGSGVKVNLTRADLDAIPEAERADYLLQEKITYAPVIATPDGPSKVEVRVMFLWPDEAAEPVAAMPLLRLSKGEMLGVDFNKNKTWVGSSAGFIAG
jgi:hypothetical protein